MTFAGPLSPPTAAPSGRLPGLDMLRGIAALCVLVLHLQAMNHDFPDVLGKGYLAVDLFFMLSGYVMARTYEPRLSGGLSPAKFFLARYRRLWPIMAIGSLIGLPKLLSEMPDPLAFLATAAANFALIPIPGEGPGFPLNIPAWSIVLELTANLVHGLLLWRIGVRGLALLVALAVPLTIWVGVSYGSLDVGAHTDQYFAGLPRVMLSYVIGMVLWRWWQDRPSIAVSPALAFAAMPLLFASAWAFGIGGWPFDLAFIAVACPLLIAGGLRYGAGHRPGRSLAAALGALSFPLYAVHMPVIQGMGMLGYGSFAGGIAALLTGCALAISIEALPRWRRRKRMETMA